MMPTDTISGPALLATIREAMDGQIDRNRRLANEFYGEMSRHYVERGERCRAALDHLAPLPDDAVLVGLTREDWERVIHVLNLSADIAAGKKSRIAADIRRQIGEG